MASDTEIWWRVSLKFKLFFCDIAFPLASVFKSKYPKKKSTKTQYLAKKTTQINRNVRKRLGRGTLNTRAQFQGLSLRNGAAIGLGNNLGRYAWTSLYRYSIFWNTEKYRSKLPVLDVVEYRKISGKCRNCFRRTTVVFYKIPTVLCSKPISNTECWVWYTPSCAVWQSCLAPLLPLQEVSYSKWFVPKITRVIRTGT